MDAIQKVNWDTVDFKKTLGDYIEMPDGSKRYIEMTMLHWYWLDFMITKNGQTTARVAQHALDVLNETPELHDNFDEEFAELFRVGIMAYGRNWVKITEGR